MRSPLPALALCAFLAFGGCMAPGYYRLEPTSGGDLADYTGDLQHSAEVELRYEPHKGFDLQATIDLRYDGQSHPRVDLSRTVVRVDGGPWEPCRQPEDTDLEALIFVLQPGETVRRSLSCLEVRQPYERLDLRFYATGTGASGTVELRFSGIQT